MSKKRPDSQVAAQSARQAQSAKQAPPAKQAAKPQPAAKRLGSTMPWHPFWRFLASVLLIMHLLAVFSAPWALTTEPALPPNYRPPQGAPPTPPAESELWQKPILAHSLHVFFNHYLNLAYLNHGYNFFAPDPAGTHIIRYQVTQPSGEVLEGVFPDKEQQWPRLFYHRHMMLAEQTIGMGPQSGQHYADHLATVHGGPSRIELFIHLLLDPKRVKEGVPLNDRSTYQSIASVNGQPRPEGKSQPAVITEEPIAIPGALQ